MDYTELVKALRETATFEYTGKLLSKRECALENLAMDASAAIEELQAELEKKRTADCWGCKCEKVEPKRGEWVVFNKQMLINLENAREQYKELGYPHRTELGLQCSNCRKVTYVDSGIKYEFCPHCGAKMEVQDG